MSKIYWKVYLKKLIKGRWRKASVTSNGRVCYSTRYWTYPPQDKNPFLFVFKSRRTARRFAGLFGERQISKCIIGKEVKVSISVNEDMVSSLPDGTVFADKVKLIS